MKRDFIVDFSDFYGSDIFKTVKVEINTVEDEDTGEIKENEIFVCLFRNDNLMFTIHFGGMKFDEDDENIIESIKSFGS